MLIGLEILPLFFCFCVCVLQIYNFVIQWQKNKKKKREKATYTKFGREHFTSNTDLIAIVLGSDIGLIR